MSTLELAALILAGEFALLAWLILFLMLRRQHKLHHADHAHAGAVMEHLETSEFTRRDALASLFESTYRLEGEQLAAKVDEYVAREKAFYNAMLSLYLNRDGSRLKEIPDELTKVLTPWAEMTPTGMIHASEVANLESEKAELTAELDNTKNTLEQLMDEYMAAFKKSTPEPPSAPPPPPSLEPAMAAEDIELGDAEMVADDLDIQPIESAEPVQPTVRSADEPVPAMPASEPAAVEETIDPADIDAMLDAFDTSPEPDRPEPDAIGSSISQEELDEALARAELEGLADLFEDQSEKK